MRLSILAQLSSLPVPQCSVFFVPPSDENGYTPLSVAIEYNRLEIINFTNLALKKRDHPEDGEDRPGKKQTFIYI